MPEQAITLPPQHQSPQPGHETQLQPPPQSLAEHYRGSPHLLDYAATKGAIVAFTRSPALQLAAQHIRVNAVAPGATRRDLTRLRVPGLCWRELHDRPGAAPQRR